MRLRFKLQTLMGFISFAFYPITSLLLIVGSIIVIDIVLGLMISQTQQGTVGYDVLLALITGATASAIVSLVIEISNNYKHNKLAWHELSEYYSVISEYELTKQVLMRTAPSIRARQKAIDEFITQGGVFEGEDDDESYDVVKSTWELLPEFMPELKKTLDSKKVYLSNREIDALRSIISNYNMIRSKISMRLSIPLLHNVLNYPDEGFLSGSLPDNILNDLPEWIRRDIAQIEGEAAIEHLVDKIMADKFVLGHYMEKYDISLHGLESYHGFSDEDAVSFDTIDLSNEDEEDEDEEDEEDEEAFRARNDAIYKRMEEDDIPFVSWLISRCCSEIADDLDSLEKLIIKKPYYGIMLRYNRNSDKAPTNDHLSKLAYESEKKRLDKRLKRQATDETSKKEIV